MATFTRFPDLPLEVQNMIWNASRLDHGQLAELSIKRVTRPDDEQTGIFKHNPNTLNLQGEKVGPRLEMKIRVIPGTQPHGIFQACRNSRAIASAFNAEVDKVIFMESSLERLIQTRIEPYMSRSLYAEAIREDFGSLKHIAAFVRTDEPGIDYKSIASRCFAEAWYRFPGMETFTAITVGRIESGSWRIFTREWDKCDEILRMSPPPINLSQDNSLFYSWLALNRRERYNEIKAEWRSEMCWKAMEIAKRMTRAERASFEELLLAREKGRVRYHTEWISHLAKDPRREWERKEKIIDWDRRQRWVKEKQTEG